MVLMLPQSYDRIFGLDIETSGSDIDEGYVLLSIGLDHYTSRKTFYREVVYPSFTMSPEALRIHKLDLSQFDTITEIRKHRPEVDRDLADWLMETAGTQKLWPVGWNVGSFDMRYVRKFLPVSNHRFGYRSIDLNATSFAVDIATNHDMGYSKSNLLARKNQIGMHNALSDATQAVDSLKELIGIIQSCPK